MDTLLLLTAKVAASTGIGLLIGLEREWAHKEAGVRSFAITALIGTLAWLVSPILAYRQSPLDLAHCDYCVRAQFRQLCAVTAVRHESYSVYRYSGRIRQ